MSSANRSCIIADDGSISQLRREFVIICNSLPIRRPFPTPQLPQQNITMRQQPLPGRKPGLAAAPLKNHKEISQHNRTIPPQRRKCRI